MLSWRPAWLMELSKKDTLISIPSTKRKRLASVMHFSDDLDRPSVIWWHKWDGWDRIWPLKRIPNLSLTLVCQSEIVSLWSQIIIKRTHLWWFRAINIIFALIKPLIINQCFSWYFKLTEIDRSYRVACATTQIHRTFPQLGYFDRFETRFENLVRRCRIPTVSNSQLNNSAIIEEIIEIVFLLKVTFNFQQMKVKIRLYEYRGIRFYVHRYQSYMVRFCLSAN